MGVATRMTLELKPERAKHDASVSLRRGLLLGLLVLLASCVPSGSAYRVVPGFRGPSVTIALDPAIGNAPALASNPLTPTDFDPALLPALDAVTNPAILAAADAPPVPMPDFAAISFDPGLPAKPFALRSRTAIDTIRAQMCLTAAIYYEAANESDAGQQAVAQVVLNRLRHPAYPDTVCDVVYQGTERGDRLCQFSFACDGSMARVPAAASWARASRAARAALAGAVYAPVGNATFYHTLAVNPVWNRSLTRAAVIGAHIFYRWTGAASAPGAFYNTHSGREPAPGPRPHPQLNLPPLAPAPGFAAITPVAGEVIAPLAMTPQPRGAAKPVSDDNRYVAGTLPESQIRSEWSGSGQWIAQK